MEPMWPTPGPLSIDHRSHPQTTCVKVLAVGSFVSSQKTLSKHLLWTFKNKEIVLKTRSITKANTILYNKSINGNKSNSGMTR